MEVEARVTGSDFGNLLRQYRLNAGLSQQALAERARMSPDAVSALERGHRRRPQRETVALLASALALEGDRRAQFELAARSARAPVGGTPVTVGPWPWSVTPVLPLALTKFFGREAELDEIATLVGNHRFVTLTGAGGVGKTQTALRAATALRDAGRATAYFVDLATIRDPSLVVSAIASALEVQEVPNRPLLETVQAYLKNRALLMVLDNCEHVLDEAAAVVVSLLTNCPHVRILATSRERLRAGGERAYRLSSLGVEDASALFADRAQAVDFRFALTAANAPVVAQICRHLDGIPLAIELAAARVDALSLEVLSEQLDHRLTLLSEGDRTALPRQQTMRATVDWSYELLTAAERQVFERLSVFAGGCTLEAARAVCHGGSVGAEDVIALISGLVRKSLVVADLEADEPRYRLLESFREYGREKLNVAGQEDAVADAHARAYLALAERIVQGRARGDVPPVVYNRHPRQELENWRAAIHWALIERHNVLVGQLLVAQVVPYWTYYTARDSPRWFSAALELVDEETPQYVVAKLYLTEARIVTTRHANYVRQIECGHKAVAYYRETDERWDLSVALIQVGSGLALLGRTGEARPFLEEAQRIQRDLDDHSYWRSFVLRSLAGTWWDDGDFAAARNIMEEAWRLSSRLGDQRELELIQHDKARWTYEEGDIESAARQLTELVTRGRYMRYEDRGFLAHASLQLSEHLIALDRFAEAESRAREALEVWRELQLGDSGVPLALARFAVAMILRNDGMCSRTMEEHVQAARILAFAEACIDAIDTETYGVPYRNSASVERGWSALREVMDADTLATARTEGRTMTEDEAVAAATALSSSISSL